MKKTTTPALLINLDNIEEVKQTSYWYNTGMGVKIRCSSPKGARSLVGAIDALQAGKAKLIKYGGKFVICDISADVLELSKSDVLAYNLEVKNA